MIERADSYGVNQVLLRPLGAFSRRVQDLGALRSQGGLVRSYKAPKKKQKHRKPAADRFDSQPGAPGLLLDVLAGTPLFKTCLLYTSDAADE